MRLFYVPNTCAIVPHIVLREGNFNFKLDKIDLTPPRKTQAGEDWAALNPKGYVPALQLDDGQLVTEVAVIAQVLADQKPESKLAPANGTMARVRLQEWLQFISTELHKGLSPLYQKTANDEFKAWWLANKVEPRLNHLSKSLEGRAYLMGEFTIADAYAFYALRWWQGPVLKGSLEKWRPLQDFWARMNERPAVKAALAADV